MQKLHINYKTSILIMELPPFLHAYQIIDPTKGEQVGNDFGSDLKNGFKWFKLC